MPRKSANKRSPREPTEEFHMSTRRRAGQQSAPSTSVLASSSPPKYSAVPPATPEHPINSLQTTSSSLSTPPTALGSTPDGLAVKAPNRKRKTRQESPTPNLANRRKAAIFKPLKLQGKCTTRASKRQRTSSEARRELPTPPRISRNRGHKSSHNAQAFKEESGPLTEHILARRSARKRKHYPGNEKITELSSSSSNEPPDLSPESMDQEWSEQGAFEVDKDKCLWPRFDPTNKIYDGADCRHRGHATENLTPPATGSPARKPRGGGNSRGGGRGGNNGRGGRGRPRGGKGGRGSGESPERKRILAPEDKALVSILKARQQELKKFFTTIGAHQMDMLELMASRDISKLVRKPKAHKQVPEYDWIFEDLEEKKEEAENLARRRYETELEAEMRRLDFEKYVIEQRYKTNVEQTHSEHVKGAEGDIMLLRNAIFANDDDARTESDSSIDLDRLPRYEENPEPNARVRGYHSTKITDERPFKHHYATKTDTDYIDLALRDVITDDIIEPVQRAFFKKAQEERAAEARKRTQNMNALFEEAVKELENIRGCPNPRVHTSEEYGSWGLSVLADISDYARQTQPDKQYVYVPLAPGETLPRQALEVGPLPGMPSPQVQMHINQSTRPGVSIGAGQLLAPAPPPRHINIPPQHQGQMHQMQQFRFQPPQTQQVYPNNLQAHGHEQGSPTGPRIPVTFVNSTVPSRRTSAGSAAGAAGGSGKGGQRMLLPKRYPPH